MLVFTAPASGTKGENNMKNGKFAAIIAVIGIMAVFAACDNGDSGTTSAHAHQWGAWTVTKDATCTTAGSRTRTCALDPSHTETEAVPINPNAHNYQKGDFV